jgi:hypothetical protein
MCWPRVVVNNTYVTCVLDNNTAVAACLLTHLFDPLLAAQPSQQKPSTSMARVSPQADGAAAPRILYFYCSLYHRIAADFPVSARQVLENLKKRVEQVGRQIMRSVHAECS